jgi:hypothetical protein
LSVSRRFIAAAAAATSLAVSGSALATATANASGYAGPCSYDGLIPYVGGSGNVVADVVLRCPDGATVSGHAELIPFVNGQPRSSVPGPAFPKAASWRMTPAVKAPCQVGVSYQATMVLTVTVRALTWHGWVPGYTSPPSYFCPQD